MELFVIVALWSGVLTLVGHGAHKRRFNVWLLLPLLTVTVFLTYKETNLRLLERDLTEAATAVAGRQANVTCERTLTGLLLGGHYQGWVSYEPGDALGTGQDIYLRADVCDTLDTAIAERFTSHDVYTANAVNVLAHEAMHVAGERNEAAAECAAMQNIVHTATLLGAVARHPHQMAVTYWTDIYPKMPTEYQSGDCGPGGPMDTGTLDAPWRLSVPE